jgi:hypothetical protein
LSVCGKDNPEGFKFCGYCTTPLPETSTETIEERKIVSVLFERRRGLPALRALTQG